MLLNTSMNPSAKRKLFYSPGSKKPACPSFLMKNQIQRSQPSETLNNSMKSQKNIRKSHEATPGNCNSQEDQLPILNTKMLSPLLYNPFKILKLTKINSVVQQIKRVNVELEIQTDLIQQNEIEENIQIQIHSPTNIQNSKTLNTFENKANGALNKSGQQTPFLNLKKLLQESPLNISRSSQSSSRFSIGSDDQQIQRNTTFSDFQIIKELGKGKTSKVLLARHKHLGMIVALKVIPKQPIKDEMIEQYIFREIKIHHYVKHENIITLYNCFSDNDNIYLMLEYMGGPGNLYQKWKKQKTFSERETQKIIANICRAVLYLHKADIIHRDIKLQNILFMNGVAKLADLGCAIHSMYMRKSQVGSPAYLSPEQLNNNFYNKKIDIWSIGIITYELLFGYSPFDQQIGAKLHNNQRKLSLNLLFPQQPEVSQNAKDFITKMLTKNPNDRHSIQLAVLHPFVSQHFKTNK